MYAIAISPQSYAGSTTGRMVESARLELARDDAMTRATAYGGFDGASGIPVDGMRQELELARLDAAATSGLGLVMDVQQAQFAADQAAAVPFAEPYAMTGGLLNAYA